MVEKLRHVQGDNVVAIVGAGHVPGMIKNWEAPVDIEALDQAPSRGITRAVYTKFLWYFLHKTRVGEFLGFDQ